MKIGDIVEITHDQGLTPAWIGLRCEVIKYEGYVPSKDRPYLKPLSDRPDGAKRHGFFWNGDSLALVKQESLW